MFLNNYHDIKNKEIYVLTFLILFSILIRIPVVYMFGDIRIENEWGIHLNGRWFLAAQHLKAWEYLFFPEGSEDLPSLRETMELLKSENLN